ncbi:YEATS domain containing 2 homolog D12 [Haematobia irritans]|uniref:YEATS domain containing 2 homolog D12 n=1 Tax=Haematobia irritans TaxID=7368 RepID=UPI003F4FA673
MFGGQQSPNRKRKHSEFHDPDYPQDNSSCADKSVGNKRSKDGDFLEKRNDEQKAEYFRKVQDVIEREFGCELAFKQDQLSEIDKRLSKARHMLDKLRYTLVSSYYKKQDLPLAAMTTSAIRAGQPLFTREDKGPQMPIHPSLKKLIGIKPKELSHVIRSCPKRTAAQNAVQTIRAKSEVHKREERKLKQIIKGQGIVIDHSLDQDQVQDITSLISAAQGSRPLKTNIWSQRNIANPWKNEQTGKPLNAARLNNKVKHLIVVGNTSKFIGAEQERDPKNKSQILTHKWLVYVQAKDTTIPIERFVRKVRFHLHHSYRPNDVVVLESPPFNVARRGWGEFPIRVQLYFHPEYNQKPVQLLHNVVLDKTLSGIQSLGAETLLEVWLRDVELNKADISYKSATEFCEEIKAKNENTKHSEVSPNEELVDENLLEFLNKIEASQNSISADIEKIQPTFVIPESFDSNSSPKPSPSKLIPKSPPKAIAHSNSSKFISGCQQNSAITQLDDIKTDNLINKSAVIENPVTQTCPPLARIDTINNTVRCTVTPRTQSLNTTAITTNASSAMNHNIVTLGKTSVALNKDSKIVMPLSSVASAVKKTTLPVPNVIANTTNSFKTSVSLSSCVTTLSKCLPVIKNNAPKQILQKKLVQLVDSTGKVKYMQMLVAASSPITSTKTETHYVSSMAPKLVTVGSTTIRPTPVTNSTETSRAVTIPIQKSESVPSSTSINYSGITMKPNIFKITPENMQTKPRIITFSTDTTTSTSSTANSVALPMGRPQVTTSYAPQPMKHQLKSNGSTVKNVVFHKEGKVYIIDPLQMKLKQQQKKQVSLLKPQVSLLKQQKQQLLDKNTTKAIDHDYLTTVDSKSSITTNNAPQVHLGLKQQRLISLNALQLMQMKRVFFEKQIMKQEFSSMQCAVEFILRRLHLIAPKESLSSAYPFITHSYTEFQSLTAFKQRSYEWLRAKHISRIIRNHKDLQHLNKTARETFWSTKEIASFARQYAYTPDIKSLPKFMEKQEKNSNDFKQLVKGELKQKEITSTDTLTDCLKVHKWINEIWPVLMNYQFIEDQNQVIDVDNVVEDDLLFEPRRRQSKNNLISSQSVSSGKSNDIYLSPPTHLENECNLVSHICKDLSIKLVPEELSPNVWYPSTQTILAHILNIFVQKVIRKSIALKHNENREGNECTSIIQQTDLAKVLSQSREFDFLTNSNFGICSKVENSKMPPVKEETL